ncbi:MBOAT family protein, partial [Corallococcus exiguus]|nr:MBOAT family protein [Corallococcus exiguus]
SWTFLVWGLWHGVGLVFVRLWRSTRLPGLPFWLGHVLTLIFVMLGWALFRSQTWSSFGVIMNGLAGANGNGFSGSFLASLRPTEVLAMLAGALVIYAPALKLIDGRLALLGLQLKTWTALALWIVALWVLQGRAVVPFLYFQF